jgi:hypothetical protein
MPTAARGTAARPRKPKPDDALSREIASLRAQVANEVSRARFSAGANIQLGDIDEEYVPNLRTLKGRISIYERMVNDPQVRGQLRAITMTLVSGVSWNVVGGTSQMRDLVYANLLRQGPKDLWCSTSWIDFLYESMGCLSYGFSLFGKTRRLVGDKVIFSDLSWLHPRSVDEDGWVMDEADNLVGVRRSYLDPVANYHAREQIAAEDLFIMTWDRRGPNYEGNAFIRPMYRPWMLGEMAEKIDIIDLQNRGVGIPVAHLSGTGGLKEKETLVEILKSLRGGSKERAFIVLDKDETVEFMTSQGTVKDAAPILAYHQMNKVKAAGTEYFEQGNTATGSRAGASALATGFFINVDGIRVHLQDMINHGIGRLPGLVEELIDMNFDNVKDYPRIEGSKVSPSEQLDNIPLIQDAVAKGALPPSMKLANEMLRRLNWPEMTKAEWDEAMASKTALSPAFGGPGRPNLAGPDAQGRDDPNLDRVAMSEKKTSKVTPTGDSQQTRRSVLWPWLKSSPV